MVMMIDDDDGNSEEDNDGAPTRTCTVSDNFRVGLESI